MGEKAILPAANTNVLPKCCVGIISFQGNLLLTPGLTAWLQHQGTPGFQLQEGEQTN